MLGINSDPVTIKQVEVEIIHRAFGSGWVVPLHPSSQSGRRVAVIGSVPAAPAAAQQLTRAGHAVTVFERDDAPGGLLRYGIPEFKLEKLRFLRLVSKTRRDVGDEEDARAATSRFRTRRRCFDLLFGWMSRLRQDRGLCLFASPT